MNTGARITYWIAGSLVGIPYVYSSSTSVLAPDVLGGTSASSRRLMGIDSTTVAIIVGATIAAVVAATLIGGLIWWLMQSRSMVLPADEEHGFTSPRSPPASSLTTPQDEMTSQAECVVTLNPQNSKTMDVDQMGLSIPWDRLVLGKQLGTGAFGKVIQADLVGYPVVIKMLSMEELTSEGKDALRQQALDICAVQHPSLAHMYGMVDDGEQHALVMRYYEERSVAAAITRPGFYMSISLYDRLKMAHQVAQGMCYLHALEPMPMLHGNLKTTNILLQTDRSVVIADFGLCDLAEVPASRFFTVPISPPEVLTDPRAPRTTAGDVYAFGITLLELVTGNMVYKGMNRAQITAGVCKGERPVIQDVPDTIASLIRDCWAQEAATRPAFVEVERRLGEALQAVKPVNVAGNSEISPA